jgi:molybdopterin molybdotransferase
MMVFTAFVRPFLSCLQGLPEKERLETRMVKGVLTSKLPSVQGRADYFPVAVTPSGGGFTATPLFGKSAMIRVLAQADGYVIVPEHVEGLDAGTEVEVHLFSLS